MCAYGGSALCLCSFILKLIYLYTIHCPKPAFKTQKMRSLPISPIPSPFPPPHNLPHSNPGASTASVLQCLDLPSMCHPGLYPIASLPMEWVTDEMSSPSAHCGQNQVGTGATKGWTRLVPAPGQITWPQRYQRGTWAHRWF